MLILYLYNGVQSSPASDARVLAISKPIDLFVVVLHPSNIWGNIKMVTNMWQCALMVTLYGCLTGTPGYWHHDLLSHSVTLSWHWANQSLHYPNNAKRKARKQHISILKSSVWLDQVLNPWALDTNPQSSDSLTSQHGRRELYSFAPSLKVGSAHHINLWYRTRPI